MNTQTLSALVAAIVGLAVGGAVLLRDPRRSVHALFATFAFNVAVQRLLMFLASSQDSNSLLRWAAMLAAVSLPATAQRFFRAFLGDEAGPPPMSRITLVGAALLYLALLSSLFLATPVHTSKWFYIGLLSYVFLGLYLSVYYLYRRYRRTPSRVEKIRLLYLLVGGLATVTAAILDLVPWAPSVGNIFITIYLFFLSQTLVRYRLLDLNELLGRMVVLAALASISTIIYGLLLIKLVDLNEIGLLFLNALIASTAIIIVFEPLRALLERVVNRWMFQEKYELFRRIESLRADRRRKPLPELHVHVLDRVDAEAVDPIVPHPPAIDLDEPLHDGRILGEHVVEPPEVAVQRTLSPEGAVAPVVVHRHVVQPRGSLGVRLVRRHERHVRKAPFRGKPREGGRGRQAVVGDGVRVKGGAGGVAVGRLLHRAVVVPVRVLDDIGGMVDDNVQVDAQAPGMGLCHEFPELGLRAEVGVDLREVEDPVPVVAGRAGLEGLVSERGGDPDGRGPDSLDVVELRREPDKVAAMEVGDPRGIKAARVGPARDSARVVGPGAVGEAVGQHEVGHLARAGVGEARHAHDRRTGGQ